MCQLLPLFAAPASTSAVPLLTLFQATGATFQGLILISDIFTLDCAGDAAQAIGPAIMTIFIVGWRGILPEP